MSLNVVPLKSDEALQAALAALSLTSRGSQSTSMSDVDAKIEATEARTDTKFAELLGELRLLNQRLDHVEKSTSGMRSTVIGTGIGIVAVVIAVMAYGAQWFGLGMDAQQVSERAVNSAIERVAPQIDLLKSNDVAVNAKLDQVLSVIKGNQPVGKTIIPDPGQVPRSNP